MVSLARDNLPPASEVLAAQPPPRPDDDGLRASIRARRAERHLLLGVLDDDPTGSQAVHDVQVVTVTDEDAYEAAFAGAAGTCFVLTNTRSLDEADAVALNDQVARGLLAAGDRVGGHVQFVSRSDSTLRGHVMAEVGALQAVQRSVTGRGFDGVLLAPAFLEAGRVTAGDIHWARVSGELVPVGDTEFARDATFGYSASDLRDFIAEGSGARVRPDDVVSLSLADIRLGGPERIAELLAGVHDGQWVVVNATEYSDLDIVAYGVLLAEQAGRSLAFRTGPSFVRSLAGMGPKAPLRGSELFGSRGGPTRHGLVVVGSHVGQTSRQVAALRERGGVTEVELDVPALLDGTEVVGAAAARVATALAGSDVVLYTSRTLVRGKDRDDSLAIARTVSAALSQVVHDSLAAGPAWVVAKGGITSHDVAVRGLGIRRAEVAGQLFPGVISVFQPLDAAPEALGKPFVVFAGNVGDDGTLADVVAILNGDQEGA
ncbi:MAG TPA: four-carbon acid sugar kinase family protein [Streptosporangiaceae bacterium]|nr:four-carbon acid sugar kinase family protein [Streptosporangiaceae bacterium]